MARSEDVKSPPAIAAFTQNVFKPQKQKSGKENYNLTLLFPKSVSIATLEAAALEAATSEWGDKARKLIADGMIKSPFLDGDGKQGKSKETGEPHKGFPGNRFIRVQSGLDFKPKVFDKKRNPVMDVDGCRSGSQVFAVVNAFTWENDEQGKGISFGVSLIQVIKNAEGDEILGGTGGGADPDKWLETIPDEGDAPAETKSGKGAEGLFG